MWLKTAEWTLCLQFFRFCTIVWQIRRVCPTASTDRHEFGLFQCVEVTCAPSVRWDLYLSHQRIRVCKRRSRDAHYSEPPVAGSNILLPFTFPFTLAILTEFSFSSLQSHISTTSVIISSLQDASLNLELKQYTWGFSTKFGPNLRPTDQLPGLIALLHT